jgi:amino acid adenylation domain-containing protein
MDDFSKPCEYYSSQRLSQRRRIGPTNAFVEFKREETEQSISERFEQQVAKYPDQIAVKTKNRGLSYDGLNKAANRVARAILAKSRDGPEPVALLLEYDTPMIVAILGVLKAGKICVPLDLSHPDARANYVLGDSQANLLVTDNKNFSTAQRLAQHVRHLINIDEIDGGLCTGNLGLSISPDTPAYILYTSGSTGQPKGVVQHHRSILHNAMKFTNGCHICADDQLTVFASFSTGQGTEVTFIALLNGASLCVIDVREEGMNSVATRLITEQITVYISTATLLRHFVTSLTGKEEFPHLRLIRIGSEQIRQSDVEIYKQHFDPRCILGIFFSATETGSMTQYYIDKETEITGSIVPVGYSAQDEEILLLDQDGKQVGFNQTGEIVIKSRYLALGYWRRPDLTQAKFLSDPNGGDKRLYFTGDLGRMSEDGCLEYLGRNDFQVKIRGYRVETGEVERALLQLNAFKEAAVIAKEHKSGDYRLVAYIVPIKRPVPTITALRHALREKLPEYMIPSTYVFLDVLPVASNGKVDRQALPAPDQGRPEVETTFVAPKDALEVELNKIWEKILGIQPIGVRDNFFELGGHSLLALQLIAQIERIFNKPCSPAILFQAPTIAQLANILRQEKWPETWSSLVPIQVNGSNPPFFWIHGQSSYAFLPHYLGPDQPLYGLMHQSEDGKPALYTTVEDITSHYLSEIRTVQPQGPYFLGGYCFGGLVAFEMAKRLKEQAQEVALLVLLEPTCIRNCRLPTPPRVSPVLSTNGESFSDRVDRHLGHLLTLEPRKKLSYVLDKAKGKIREATTNLTRPVENLAKRVACNLYLRLGYPLPPSLRSPYILDIYSQAIRRHALRPYEGPITIFLTKEPFNDPSLNWHVLTSEPLEIHEIPGNHTDILKEPYLRVWSEQLKIYLDRAQSNH